ncbi:MAG: 3-isopropylmalate dehydratase small subunit [Maioricimonas sp. JB045]|uniref:3-isopropylmalate dehydratase small subunit n=1 Tax=Maioricimonas sp. JC845 TaxID=3232138 RepID=UPI00345B3C51
MSKITKVTGTGVHLFLDDIDTDRIIPARYLRCVSFDGLGEHAFKDDREQDPEHPFNHEHYQNASILVSGRNFGCGSSREHAPQALMRWGIQAVVAESFAEIFFGNCTSLGIPAVCAEREHLQTLAEAIAADPQLEMEVDIHALELRFGEESIPVKMPEGARGALVSGQWDFLTQLLENGDQIRETAATLPYMTGFAG